MRIVTIDEVLPIGAYEEIRDRFRARILAHKRTRRVFLGPEMTLLFEDHDTVLAQIQEMLRAERVTAPKAMREEIAAYNLLVPADGELLATLMIELEDAAERERRRRDFVGLDEHLHLAIGPHRIAGSFDAEGRFEDRVAVVRYVNFKVSPGVRSLLLDERTEARVVVDHPRYAADVALSLEARRSLADTLDPENAQRA